jgi:hypothetical protein
MKSYRILSNTHVGESCFILGAGPSLYYDFYCSFKKDKIDNHVVISVNSSIIVTDWDTTPDSGKRFWISNDALCKKWSYWPKVMKSNATKIVRNSWLKYEKELPDFLMFKPRPSSEDIINADEHGLSYCSSVPSSIDLAIQMGCKYIFLLGVDQREVDGVDHFWQYFPRKDRPRQLAPAQANFSQQKKVFPINNLAYKALAEFAVIKEVEIYNCSSANNLIFRHMHFEAALNMAKGSKNENR